MSRSLTGNLIGSAAHGEDDITAEETPYAVKLKSALAKLKVIFDNPEGYLNWMLRKTQERDGIGMLEEAEIIIAQCELWDNEHPVDAAQSIEQAIDATLHAENVGTHTIVSGGEVLELGTTSGHDDEVIF